MAAATDKLENSYIDWFFRAQALGISGASAGAGTGPSTLYIGLFTAAPSDTPGSGTEVSGGNYSRASVPSSLANWAGTQGAGTTTVSTGSSGTTSNNNPITFPAPTGANWGVVTHFGIFDASSGGNLLYWGALNVAKTVNNGDSAPLFAAGSLSVQVDN